jgi:ABC-2 type transport system permease protein
MRAELHSIWLIFSREYFQRVKSLSFLLTTLMTPVFFIFIAITPALFEAPHLISHKHIAIACADPALSSALEKSFEQGSIGRYIVTIVPSMSPQERARLTEMVRRGQLDGYAWLDNASISSGRINYISGSSLDFLQKQDIRASFAAVVRRERMRRIGLSPQQIEAAFEPIDLNAVEVQAGSRMSSGSTVALFVLILFITTLEMSLLSYGIIVMRSVLDDKSSRVMELLLCAATPRALMTGKILGVGALSFTQVVIWAAMAAAGTLVGSRLVGPGSISAFDISGMQVLLLVAFYVLGYLLYSSMYAALGAAFNSIDEAQHWNFVLTLPLLFASIAAWSLVEHPNSLAALVLSFVPPFAPVMMSMRIATAFPSAWQIGLSLGLMVLALYGALVVSSRIYRVGILMHGKKPSVREISRWARYA